MAMVVGVALSMSAGAAPLPVHALTVPDPVDADAGEQLAERVAWLLGTAGYVTISSSVLEGRIGESPAVLRRRCGSDVACWRRAGEAAGLEQVVLIDRVDADTFGVRIVDVGADRGFRQGIAGLTAGWPEPELVDRLFGGLGALRIDGLPESASVQIDGGPSLPAPFGITIDPVTAGKHTLEFTADAHVPLFMTLMVYPDQQTELSAAMAVEQAPPRKRKVGWVGLGVVAAAVAAVLVSADGGVAGAP